VRETVAPQPGEQHFLYDLNQAQDGDVIAVTGRLEAGTGTESEPFVIKAPEGIGGQLVIASGRPPQAVWLQAGRRTGDAGVTERADAPAQAARWTHDPEYGLLRVECDGSPDGVYVWIE
jgi:hypothetical protein